MTSCTRPDVGDAARISPVVISYHTIILVLFVSILFSCCFNTVRLHDSALRMSNESLYVINAIRPYARTHRVFVLLPVLTHR